MQKARDIPGITDFFMYYEESQRSGIDTEYIMLKGRRYIFGEIKSKVACIYIQP